MNRRCHRLAAVLFVVLTMSSLSAWGQAPAVVSVSPAQNALNVSPTAVVTVTFDTDMDGATINSTTLLVQSPMTGLQAGTVGYDAGTRTAWFDADVSFTPGDVISVALTVGVTSSVGVPLDRGFVWTFRVVVREGEGAFEPAGKYVVYPGSHTVSAADLNADGHVDLAVTNWHYEGPVNTLSILMNNGDGSFAPEVVYGGGNNISCVEPADLDRDGDLDLIVTAYASASVLVHMNNGDGTLAPFAAYGTGSHPDVVTAVDLNSDGYLDIAAACVTSNGIAVLLNNGDGTFAPYTLYPVGGSPNCVVAADFNADGVMDLATDNSLAVVAVLLGSGGGAFDPYVHYVTFDGANRGIEAADFDHDGDADLATASVQGYYTLSIMANDGNGVFSQYFPHYLFERSHTVQSADLDADGDLDIGTTARWASGTLTTSFNYGDATFEICGRYAAGDGPQSIAFADYDNDGDLDAAVVNTIGQPGTPTRDTVYLFFNVGPHPCPELQAPLNGSITGNVLADCPAENTGLLGVTVDVYEVGSGTLVGSVVTDADGAYRFDDLEAGDYTVTIVVPLGYTAVTDEVQVGVVGGDIVTADFYLSCQEITSRPRTIGFWKHQVGVATGGNGNAQVDAQTLCQYLDLVWTHFAQNGLNPVSVYTVPSSALCEDKLLAARELLNLKGSAGMTARAKQQLTALLLNVVAGYVSQTQVISTDGATLSQAVTFCDNLIDDPNGDHETAKTVADLINNGQMVPAGVIPLSTANIAYKNAGNGPGEFWVGPSYPNPFNPVATIEYSVPSRTQVTIEIFNVVGQRVRTLVSEVKAAGSYRVQWTGTDDSGQSVATGVYLYRVSAGESVRTMKMLYLK